MTNDATLTCLEVRELLPEFALGVLPEEDGARVERHLAWCAGCRKESSDLGVAAATFAFALPPADVPDGLDDRIVQRVRTAAAIPRPRRRLRTVAGWGLAAAVAFASLGWGAVMAGRAERFERRAATAAQQQADALERFRKTVLGGIVPVTVPTDDTHLGQLAPTPDGVGGGAVLQLVSPRLIDFTIVIVNGLDPEATERLPYRVHLVNATGEVLRVGRIEALDGEGGGEVYREFDATDLTGFTEVSVVDAAGTVVLRGTIDQSA